MCQHLVDRLYRRIENTDRLVSPAVMPWLSDVVPPPYIAPPPYGVKGRPPVPHRDTTIARPLPPDKAPPSYGIPSVYEVKRNSPPPYEVKSAPRSVVARAASPEEEKRVIDAMRDLNGAMDHVRDDAAMPAEFILTAFRCRDQLIGPPLSKFSITGSEASFLMTSCVENAIQGGANSYLVRVVHSKINALSRACGK